MPADKPKGQHFVHRAYLEEFQDPALERQRFAYFPASLCSAGATLDMGRLVEGIYGSNCGPDLESEVVARALDVPISVDSRDVPLD